MHIGTLLFEGQHQQYLGTSFVVGAPGKKAPSPQDLSVHALTQRRIVMKLVSGSLGTLSVAPAKAAADVEAPR
jgi:hypothetical protein